MRDTQYQQRIIGQMGVKVHLMFRSSVCTCFIPTLGIVEYQHLLVFHWYNEQVLSYCVAPLEAEQNKNTFGICSVVCAKVK